LERRRDDDVDLVSPAGAFAAYARAAAQLDAWHAAGVANLTTGEPLTPRHRFRIASHSKSFTATGLMLLRERGRLKLDDTIGTFVDGLHDEVARATIGQLMSHTAGLTRDGSAGNQYSGLRPFANKDEVLADLSRPPVIDRNTRFKYSNHGFALL
jgi:CubicO group peptidase (beta-lactamase class C family)